MVGDLSIARNVLQTGGGIGEGGSKEIFRLHALNLGRILSAPAAPRNGEGDVGIPPPVRAEHRRVEKRLDQDLFHRFRTKELEDTLQWKGMLRSQREQQGV